jgi:hypothetical protein
MRIDRVAGANLKNAIGFVIDETELRRIARRPCIIDRSRKADDMRAVGSKRLHGFESDAGLASGYDHSLARQIDAGQHLIGS